MYTPRAFAESDPERLFAFIEAHPFATLVSAGDDGTLVATHLPLLLDRDAGAHGVLTGHLAKANDQLRQLATARDVLVIVPGVDAYVSPGWYPSKLEHGRAVPTWNYVAVHAYATPTLFDDATRLRAHVAALTDRHESGRAPAWSIDDAPPEYVDGLLRGITGVELAITRLEGKWKMSQNRPGADIDGVVAALSASPDPRDRAVGTIVAERRPARD